MILKAKTVKLVNTLVLGHKVPKVGIRGAETPQKKPTTPPHSTPLVHLGLILKCADLVRHQPIVAPPLDQSPVR